MQTIKHLICCALLLVLAAGCAARPALKIIQRPPGIAEETGAITPPVPKRDFTAGESYRYRIDWLGVPVGIVYFDISGVKPLKGREVYVVTLRAETNKFASKIYRVEDSYTSYVDTERFIPLRYDVDRKEGGYRKRATTYFDHEGGEAHFENFLDGSKKTYKIPDGVLDPVSAILKARTLELEVGTNNVLKVANNEKVYTIHAYGERREFIRIDELGDFEAVYVTPTAVLKGKRVKKGTISTYISCDTERRLLYAEVEAPLFTKMTATLLGAEEGEGAQN